MSWQTSASVSRRERNWQSMNCVYNCVLRVISFTQISVAVKLLCVYCPFMQCVIINFCQVFMEKVIT